MSLELDESIEQKEFYYCEIETLKENHAKEISLYVSNEIALKKEVDDLKMSL